MDDLQPETDEADQRQGHSGSARAPRGRRHPAPRLSRSWSHHRQRRSAQVARSGTCLRAPDAKHRHKGEVRSDCPDGRPCRVHRIEKANSPPRSLDARGVRYGTPVGSVARAFASRMELPGNVPWSLRNDRTGAILDEEKPIGEEIETGDRVVVTPRSHLGAA